jgi:hypothetical protein
MANLLTSCVLTEGKHVDILNGNSHKKILPNLGWITVHFNSDYTQLVTPETQMTTNSTSDNGIDGQEKNIRLCCKILAHFVMCMVPSSTPLNWMS